MKLRILYILLTLAALLFSGESRAQDYRFSVDENRSDVFIREDGGIDIEYVLTFTCAPGAHPIDIVDVGLPNRNYSLNSAKAWLDGVRVPDIRRSQYVAVGIEVHLGDHVIEPGQSGTLQVTVTNPRMVFPDEDPNYASVEFYPTYYGSKYTQGTTRLQVAFHFPEGASKDQVKWHYKQFTDTGYDEQSRLVYIWRDERARPDRQYKFGVSFPKNLVTKVFTAPAAAGGNKSKAAPPTLGQSLGAFFIMAAFFLIFFGPFIAMFGLFWYLGRRRRMKYFPPVARTEGIEIKRGLTAPEAAIVLELPLDRVFAMIIFGLVRKGIIEVLPGPRFRVVAPPREALHPYEAQLLGQLRPDGKLTIKEIEPVMINLIKDVQGKLKNFSLPRTREYYRRIVSIAWCEVENARTVADLTEQLDAQMEWVMADREMPSRLKNVMTDRWVSTPWWWVRYHGPAFSGPAMPAAGGQPGLSGVDFADAVVSRIEGMADRAISSLTSLTMDVTQVTNPPPVRTYSGGGGGCACACAGCACACAGGGR